MTAISLYPFTPEETRLIRRHCRPNDEFVYQALTRRIAYQKDGNFTKCVMAFDTKIKVGIAKRNPTDPPNGQTAMNIAFVRALRSDPIQL